MPSRLHVTRHGPPQADHRRRVVLVHGFTQTAASWSAIAAGLAGYEVLVPDVPGHGRSAGVEVGGFAEAAQLVAGAGGAPATYVGYSMGGRLCLQAALDDPAQVRALVVVSATAGIEDAGERAARRARDGRLADRLDPPPVAAGGTTEEPLSLEEFLDEWLAQPLFAPLPRELAGLDARRANTLAGLAASLRTCGTGNMAPLWDRLGELQAPALVVAGELDGRAVELGERLAAGIDGAMLEVVAGAGHAVPFEAPVAFTQVLRRFLARL